MAMRQMVGSAVAVVVVDHKEKGDRKRLVATQLRASQFVTANVITRLLGALVQTALLLGLGVLVFKSHVNGSYGLIALLATLGGLMFLGLGFTISGIAKTADSVPAIANIFVFPMLFLSGIFLPTAAMPSWLQKAVEYLPLTHFARSMRDVVGSGAGFSTVAHDVYWMLGWAVVLTGTAIFTFGLEEKRQ